MSARLVLVVCALCAVGSLGAPAAAAPAHTAFALIVTNNRSGILGRPDLQYADDDGARYYELFQTLTTADHIKLLTELDRDSARLFPKLVPIVVAPSRAHVAAAAAALSAQIADAVRAGQTVDFYFVFAGHGDVEHGRGFLQLTDGAFDADDLEALLASIHATREHVILDSCNSFFVINARRPGGRRFATPDDAATGLAQRLPNVGVFVSTSAEAEVFEWSELQSGVFSHAVRSGLAGAADANGDGAISYDELRAFVDTATAEIRNAAFRPKVFARGPGGDDKVPLFAPTTSGTRLTLDATRAVRMTVRDRDELPWLDVFKEAGAPLTLRLPPDLVAGSADELAVDAGDAHVVRRSALPADPAATIAVADLPSSPIGPAARGPDELFRRLFTRPFGPHALASYDDERAAAPPPVFGVSRDDADRMQRLLAEADDEQREVRQVGAGVTAATGLVFAGVAVLAEGSTDANREIYAISAASLVGLAAYQFWRHPDSERLSADLRRGLASASDPSLAVAAIDRRLHAVAAQARHDRRLESWVGGFVLAGAGTLYAVDRFGGHQLSNADSTFQPMLAASGIVGAFTVIWSCIESPIERTTRLWDSDPGTAVGPRLGLVPVHAGAALTLGVQF